MPQVHTVLLEIGIQSQRVVDEELGVLDVASLLQFTEKLFSQVDRLNGINPRVEEFVRIWITRREDPKSHAGDLDDRLNNGNLLRL